VRVRQQRSRPRRTQAGGNVDAWRRTVAFLICVENLPRTTSESLTQSARTNTNPKRERGPQSKAHSPTLTRSASEGLNPECVQTPRPEAPVLKLRYFVNREAMAGTSPGLQSGETAKSEPIVSKGRQADPDKISVVPSGLLGRVLLLDHGLTSMAVTCHAFGIQNRNFKQGQR